MGPYWTILGLMGFNSDDSLKSKASHLLKKISSYQLAQKTTWRQTCQLSENSSLSMTVITVPWLDSDGPIKSKVFHFKNLRHFNFQALGPKFVLSLEPRVLKVEGSFFGIRPSIYVLRGCYETPQKSSNDRDFGGGGVIGTDFLHMITIFPNAEIERVKVL